MSTSVDLRALMQAAQKMILHIEADIDALKPITPAELAAGFPGDDLRRQFTNGMMVMALTDGPPQAETVAAVSAYAKDIFMDELALRARSGSPRACCGCAASWRIASSRRVIAPGKSCPKGTLGRELIDFYNEHGFTVPGERGGFPEAGLFHDFCHLLGGYRTEPEGELQVASFRAGFKKERPFYVALFAVMIFSAGVQMRPSDTDFTTIGVLGKPGVAELMLAAIERGSKVNVDLTDQWDYWPWVETPIDEVRRKLNILPTA